MTLILNLKAKTLQEGANLKKYLSSASQEKCSHFISRSRLVAHLPATTPRRRRWAPRTAPLALAAFLPSCVALPGPSSSSQAPRAILAWRGARQLLGYIWSLTGDALPSQMSSAFCLSQASRLHRETVWLPLLAGLLIHLEFPVSFPATLLKLPGKLLWPKISSSTPGMSAPVWMWTDYLCCWNTSTVGKSTINYICYSTHEMTY